MNDQYSSNSNKRKQLGIVTHGSLSSGLEMRLSGNCSVEDLRVGRFVVVDGRQTKFFSMLTDVTLSTANPKIIAHPPSNDSFVLDVLAGGSTYSTVKIQPMLMLENKSSSGKRLGPVKTIPSHFSSVFEAEAEDFALVFGQEDANDSSNPYFNIGQPLNMNTPVCINLEKFVERSNGIFGKSGTGKSFLTRILLGGIASKDIASLLIFDMHNEYGWQSTSEDKSQPRVKGLRQLFGNSVIVFSLDQESSSSRGVPDVHDLFIGLDQIEIEDLELLKTELALSEATVENAYIAREKFGHNWISTLLSMSPEEIDEFCQSNIGHPTALKTLQRRLTGMIQRITYLKPRVSHNYIQEIIRHIQSGRHVVLEFGRQNNLLSYMLATNIITRRIHAEYVKQSEVYMANPESKAAPRKLMIVVEEAHKFLSPQLARQTIFGIIAREMRKYNVTLLIIDQRPSGIDPEVLSQIGTRVTALLNDEKDIDAVFTGISGSNALRTVLAQMDPKQQALILGYATPMPVVVKTRAYDLEFYKAVSNMSSLPSKTKSNQGIDHPDQNQFVPTDNHLDSLESIENKAKKAGQELFG